MDIAFFFAVTDVSSGGNSVERIGMILAALTTIYIFPILRC